MKLEVGMYVRGNYYQFRGKIGKIIKNYQNELEIAYKNGVIKTSVGDFIDDNWDINGKQYKASYDILDLIELGDYVNGLEVVGKDPDGRLYLNKLVWNTYEKIYQQKMIEGKDIKSVVTKEQLSQMEYKIGE